MIPDTKRHIPHRRPDTFVIINVIRLDETGEPMRRKLLAAVATATLAVTLAPAPAHAVITGATGCNTNVSTLLGSWNIDADATNENVYHRHTGTSAEIGYVYVGDGATCYGYLIPQASSYDWVLFSPPTDLDGQAGLELAVSWQTTPGPVLNTRKTWIITHRTLALTEVASGGNLSWDWQYDLDSLPGNDLLFTYQTINQADQDWGKVKTYSTQNGLLKTFSLNNDIPGPRFDQRVFGELNGVAGIEAAFLQYPYIQNGSYNGGWVKILDVRGNAVRSYSTTLMGPYPTSTWSLYPTTYAVTQTNGSGGLEVTVYYQLYNTFTHTSTFKRWVINATSRSATLYNSW